jgi:rhodanese-related sulfurtransferase
VARKLMEMGFPEVYALKDGWKAWRKAGFPVEPK